MQQVYLIVSGTVQGVCYRMLCKKIAVSYDLKGWVRNLPTGEVEVLAQGEKEKLVKLVDWCKTGPPHANVVNVEVQWGNVINKFESFNIK